MSRRFEGKVALVTGAGSGIGRAAALRLLADGARVIAADFNRTTAEETVALAREQGCGDAILAVPGDVAEEADNAAMVQAALSHFGRLDFAFLNAGVGGAFGPIGDTLVGEWDYTFQVLVRGVFLGLKHASTAMRRQGGGGAIVATASVAGLTGGAGSHAYSAAKAAVISLTGSVATELAPYRIRVNAVAPGVIATPLTLRGRTDGKLDVPGRAPWPDQGMPDHIAGVVSFLLSEDAGFITGETVVVDGGLIAQGSAVWGIGADNKLLKRAGVNRGSTGEASLVRDVSHG